MSKIVKTVTGLENELNTVYFSLHEDIQNVSDKIDGLSEDFFKDIFRDVLEE